MHDLRSAKCGHLEDNHYCKKRRSAACVGGGKEWAEWAARGEATVLQRVSVLEQPWSEEGVSLA